MNLVRRLTTIAGAIAWPTICVVIGCVVFVICFGGTRVQLEENRFGSRESWEHGWPMAFLERSTGSASSRFGFTDDESLHSFRPSGRYSLRWRPLALDILIFVGIIGALVSSPYLIAARQRTERRGLAFSLSTLLALLTFSCLLLGNVGQSLSVARREQATAVQLKESGHFCDLEYVGPLWLARLNGDLAGEQLSSFNGVTALRLDYLEIAPDFERLAASVQSLRNFDEFVYYDNIKGDNRLTDVRLRTLLTPLQRSRLKTINLSQSKVSGIAFANAREWPRLRSVDLYGSSIDDAGFANLTKIRTIDNLNVGRTLITKRNLELAAKMPNLRIFYAQNCGLKEEDVAELTSRGVNCSVSIFEDDSSPLGPPPPFPATENPAELFQ